MYGYPRITKYFKEKLNLSISHYLIYCLMKKPRSYTEIAQRPNLIKKLKDKSSVLLTDIIYIPVKRKWVYLVSLYNPVTRPG